MNVNQFGKIFSLTVDGQVYAQPLYVPSVSIPGQGVHNVVYVATENDSVYAFDADQSGPPLWQTSLGTAVGCWKCANLTPIEGITATPVIDPGSGTMYVINVSKVSGVLGHYLHALDITSGSEKFGGPVRIQATVPGTGEGGTTITYNETFERMRTALTLVNGMIVWGTGSYEDSQPYHGWIFAYNAATLQQAGVFVTTPNSVGGGVWQSGGGFVVDDTNNVYFMTGNGFGSNQFDGTSDFTMSVVKLGVSGSGFQVTDYFAPYNWSYLSGNDDDLSSAGPMRIPGTNFLIGAGKEGRLYLLNMNSLGHFNASSDQIIQELQVTVTEFDHNHCVPVFWNGPAGQLVYIWAEGDHLKAWLFNGSVFQTTPAFQSVATAPMINPNTSEMPGGFMSLSANGNTPGTGIVWGNAPYSGNAVNSIVPGILHAFDASNLSNELWHSYQNQSRDDYGNFAKFVAPTVANGKVYMATFSNQLVVYGLLNTAPAAPTNLTATAASDTSVNLTWTASTSTVAGYQIFRGGSQIATSSTTSYQDTGLKPSTNYSYTVKAYDSSGNVSPASNTANATTLADTNPPTSPTNVSVASTTATTVNLTWTASTDDVGVTGYQILRNGTQVGTSTSTSYQDTGLTPATNYSYTVKAYDAAGNVSPVSNTANATTSADTTPPTAPTNLSVASTTSTTVNLTWTASTDNIGVTGYQVLRNGTQVGTSTSTSYQDTGLTPATNYSYTVKAYDAAGNVSPASNTANATTAGDTTPPTAPTNLSVASTTSTTVSLTWTASTDNVGVTGYQIFRNGTQVGTSTSTSFQDTGLTPSTTYTYTVKAFDAAGNVSAASNSVQVTTTQSTTKNLTLSTAQLTFYTIQVVGTTSGAKSVVVTNTSSSVTIAISTIVMSGDFVETDNCVGSLGPSKTCTINVSFKPTASGTRTGTVTITDSDATSPQKVSLTGTGSSFKLSTNNIAFSTPQTVGTSSGSKPVTVTNLGSTAVTVSSIGMSGDFSETDNCIGSLGANASCTINVVFKPTASGTRTGTITINDADPGSPQKVTLSGTGTGSSTVKLSTTTLTFYTIQLIGTTSGSKSVTVTNTGSTSITVSGVAMSGDFTETDNCVGSLASNATCTINVSFKPTASGTRTGTVTITDSDPTSPQKVSLTGTGSSVKLSTNNIVFATAQTVGTSSGPKAMTVSNPGPAAVTISAIAMSGDFSETDNCIGSLGAGASCTINVVFKPTATGTRTGTMTITDADPSSPQKVTLTGTGK